MPAGGELMDEAGGEGKVGWRKPPGASEVELMEENMKGLGQDALWWGSVLPDREGEARLSMLRAVHQTLALVSNSEYFPAV